jgi:hypothetical protein
MDEPLQGVDAKTEAIIMDTIREFKKKGKTIVVVHHDLSTVNKYFEQVILINKQLIAAGKVAEVFNRQNIKLAYGE